MTPRVDNTIDFNYEASDLADLGGDISISTAVAWARSIAARVESQTLRQCKFLGDNIHHFKPVVEC